MAFIFRNLRAVKYVSSLGIVARLRLYLGLYPEFLVTKTQFKILKITIYETPVNSSTSALACIPLYTTKNSPSFITGYITSLRHQTRGKNELTECQSCFIALRFSNCKAKFHSQAIKRIL